MGKHTVIGKSAATAGVLLLIYSSMIGLGIPDWMNKPESQWSHNISAAEEILFSTDCPTIILVGSSLARRLPEQVISAEVFNLSFAAMSANEGLRLLQLSGKAPKLILVETNMLFRPEDREFNESLFLTGMRELRASVPALRHTNRPLNNICRLGLEAVRFAAGKKSALAGAGPVNNSASQGAKSGIDAPRLNTSLFEAMLKREVEAHVSPPSDEAMSKLRSSLATMFADLIARGTRIVLIEVPVHAEVAESPLYHTMRDFLSEHFSGPEFTRLDRPDPSIYVTTDGVHLTAQSASRFAREVKAQLRDLGFKTGG